jgi:hypothetical protein
MRVTTLLKHGITPHFAQLEFAAPMVGLEPAEFSELVDAGALPPPCEINGKQLYDMADVVDTLRGKKPEVDQGFEL